jgi:hypothetical protein
MQILGLHFDYPFLRLALLEEKGKEVEIRSLRPGFEISGEDVKRLYTNIWKGPVATGIDSLVRLLDIKLSNIQQVEQGLPFQIESLTHVPIEEMSFVSSVRSKEEGAEATVFLATKKAIRDRLEECKNISIDLDLLTAIPQALVSFANFRCPDLSSAFLVNLGSQDWTCAWMEKGLIKKSFTIHEGIESLLSTLWEDRKRVLFQKEVDGVAKQIDLMQLKEHLNPHLSKQLEKLRGKLTSALFSFRQAAGPRPVLFTGRLDSFGHLREYLLDSTLDLGVYDPTIPFSSDEQKCAIAIGLALELHSKRIKPIQFLKGEFTPRKTWLKAGLWAAALLACSVVLSGGLSAFGRHQIQAQKAEMVERLRKLSDPKQSRSLTTEEDSIEQAISLIEKHNKEEPYLLQSPTVSEVITWVAKHPLLEIFVQSNDPLEVTGLKYQLLSFPKIANLKEPYEAKVELEFKAKSPMNARKFHEALLQGDELVDSGKEITWETQSECYKTTFYLKNRTPHVH